jgi:hypothetical protein
VQQYREALEGRGLGIERLFLLGPPLGNQLVQALGRRRQLWTLTDRLSHLDPGPVTRSRLGDVELLADFGEGDVRDPLLRSQLAHRLEPDFFVQLLSVVGDDLVGHGWMLARQPRQVDKTACGEMSHLSPSPFRKDPGHFSSRPPCSWSSSLVAGSDHPCGGRVSDHLDCWLITLDSTSWS